MFDRLARFVVRHARLTIGLWLVAAIAIVPFSPKLGEVTNSDEASFLPSSYESVQAARLADRAFPEQSGATGVLVFQRADGGRLTAADQGRLASVAQGISGAGIDRVRGVRTGAASPDGRLQLAQVRFAGSSGEDAVMDAAQAVRDETARRLDGSGLRAGMTGEAAIKLDDRDAHGTAEKTVGIATISLILLLLLAMFRSPIAALLPIASIALVFLTANSLIALAAQGLGFDVSLDLPPLLTVVLFGIGTDYILFTLFRYRENLRTGARGEDALIHAAGRVGEVISFAALVVIVAFSALALSQLGSLQTMAPGLVIGVALMWLAGVTLIPAVLSLLGPRVFWPSRTWQREPRASAYRRVGQLIARRPGRVALASGGALAALAVGALFYTADHDSINQLPGGAESRQAFENMRASFPAGSITPTQVYVTGDERLDRAKVLGLAAEHQHPDGVASVGEPAFSADGRTARIDVVLKDNPYSHAALDAVDGPIRDAAHASGAGQRVLVGGQTAASVDIRTATNRDFALVFPVAALAIGLLLAWLLRSLVAPLYLLGAVMLGFAATLGFTVATFQGGLGEPGLKSMLPIIVYLFVVAVGTDYSILMTARLREEALRGRPTREATALGVEHGGPAIGAAGLILAGTFTALLLTGIASLMQIGFAVSSGILIAAGIMATLLVPSLTMLLGRAAWWPGHRDERGPRPGEEPAGATSPESTDDTRGALAGGR
ncbi:MAG: MMPL family transporter [Solirubrobacteraceae bacterium]|nr:MMPL family transporter [Solirubrobacteraceae bacterium]